jgi:FlaA1/EpsC-like NDP-sugar epimerase
MVDVFVVVASYMIALGFRMLDPLVGDSSEFWGDLILAMPLIILVHILANVVVGAYGHVWEHASMNEALRVALANASAIIVLLAITWFARSGTEIVIPYQVVVLGGLLSLLAMGLVRFRSRLFSFHKTGGAPRVLIVGTGREAAAFSRAAPTLDGGRSVVGFVADDEHGLNGHRKLAGLEVVGRIGDITQAISTYDIDEVVVVGGDATRARRVVDLCLEVDVRLRIMPGVEELIQDGVAAVDVRDIRVEDILVRKPVETDLAQVGKLIKGKRVLVTGAGGSIGSEIVGQVLTFDPASVCALDRDETLLHDAELRWPGQAHVELGDIRDLGRMIRLFEAVRPEIVFHAAALKHVPVLEDHPEEAVLTNVVGTRNVIEAGSRVGMERFILISTDKAVDPISVMGATKRAAEIMTQVGSERGDGCVYTAVRFGNVLGSRGSVIPTFVEQIQSGGPVTVTDAEMTRYFMTVNEAVQLVLQASALALGSEVFLLDMGEPVKIDELARRLIRLAGLTPGRDVGISYTGRRPGEKLTEVLSHDTLEATAHEKIYDVRLNHPRASTLMEIAAEMETEASNGNSDQVVALLNDLAGGHLAAAPTTVDLTQDESLVSWS